MSTSERCTSCAETLTSRFVSLPLPFVFPSPIDESISLQLPAHSLSIDRKIRTHLYDPKTLLAIKLLREKWRELFLRKMKDPAAPLDPALEPWLALVREALESGFVKAALEAEKAKSKETKEKVKLSLTRNDVL